MVWVGGLSALTPPWRLAVRLLLDFFCFLFPPATTYAHKSSISSDFSNPPHGGMLFLPFVTELTKRECWSRGNVRRSNAPCGSAICAPWQGEQFRAKIAAPASGCFDEHF